MTKQVETKILYNLFYMVAEEVLSANDKNITPYELNHIADNMANCESVSSLVEKYSEWVLDALDEVE